MSKESFIDRWMATIIAVLISLIVIAGGLSILFAAAFFGCVGMLWRDAIGEIRRNRSP